MTSGESSKQAGAALHKARVLVVEDDRAARKTMQKLVGSLGYEVETEADGRSALERIRRGGWDACLLDLGLPVMGGMEVLEAVHESETDGRHAGPAIIVVSAWDDMESTIRAVQLGAYDYLVKPVDPNRLRITLSRAMEQRRTNLVLDQFIERDEHRYNLDSLVGKSEAMREVFKRIGAVAANRATVLITGESGTGKELVARAIHQASQYANEPFVAVNCSAFSPNLLESELFGHVRGAFTGAVASKVGRFELAGNGTLFLDEIAELSVPLQTKLLRVLQERSFERVGDSKSIPLRARVLAATHRDLHSMMEQGTFRHDLFYRLGVVEIHLPPLRERPEDIPLLVSHLLRKIGDSLHKHVQHVSEEAMRKLQQYHWPGNVRELENALTRAVVLAKGPVVGVEDLPLFHDSSRPASSASNSTMPPLLSLRELEKRHIQRVLDYTGWHKRKACAILEITRPTLDRKIRVYGLQKRG